MVAPVNFFQPGTDPAIESAQVMRQRALADMLTRQSMTPDQGQMVSGHYIAPGAGSYIAQLANALGGVALGRKADQNERDMATTLATQRQKDAAGIMEAMTGKPAVPAQNVPLNVPNDDEGNPLPSAGQTAAIPAQGPDMSKALAIALQSQDPTMRGLAPDMMKRQMDAAEFQQAVAAAGGGGAGAPAAGGAPGAATGGAGPNSFGLDPAAFAFGASPNARAQALGKMIQEANKPQILAEGGTLLTPQGKPIYIAPKTEAGIQINNGVASGVPNYGAAKAQQAGQVATATQNVESDNTMVTIKGPDNRDYTMTRSQAKQLLGGGGPAPAVPPGYANEGQMRSTAGGDMGQDPAALQRELSALRSDLQKVPDANSKRMIQDEINRLEGQAKTYGAGAGRGAQGGAAAMPGIAGPDPTVSATNQALATKTPEVLMESRAAAKAAQDELMAVAEARTTAKAGIYAGSGADAKLATAKFINSWVPFVNIDPDKVANTDYVKSVMGSGLLKQAKTLGANPTDADAKRLDDILGTINKDPKALGRLLDWRETMARNALNNHSQMMQSATSGGVRSPIDMSVQTPTPNANGGFRIIGVQ